MKVCTENHIQYPADLAMFWDIKRALDSVLEFDFPDNHSVSCHELCAAIANIYPLRVETGYYLPGFEHSWLRTTSNAGEITPFDNLIDVYPVGMVGGPLLVENSIVSFMNHCGFYKTAKIPDLDFESDRFKNSVNIITETLKKQNIK